MKKIIPALIFTAAAAGATAIYIKKKLTLLTKLTK